MATTVERKRDEFFTRLLVFFQLVFCIRKQCYPPVLLIERVLVRSPISTKRTTPSYSLEPIQTPLFELGKAMGRDTRRLSVPHTHARHEQHIYATFERCCVWQRPGIQPRQCTKRRII